MYRREKKRMYYLGLRAFPRIGRACPDPTLSPVLEFIGILVARGLSEYILEVGYKFRDADLSSLKATL